MTPTPDQIAAVVRKHVRIQGVAHDHGERTAQAIVAAILELYPAITLAGPARALRVGHDDVIAIRCDQPVSMEAADEIKAQAERVFPGHRVVVLDRAYITVARPGVPPVDTGPPDYGG